MLHNIKVVTGKIKISYASVEISTLRDFHINIIDPREVIVQMDNDEPWKVLDQDNNTIWHSKHGIAKGMIAYAIYKAKNKK